MLTSDRPEQEKFFPKLRVLLRVFRTGSIQEVCAGILKAKNDMRKLLFGCPPFFEKVKTPLKEKSDNM